MNYIAYTARFLYRIKWWMILAPIIVALAVFFKMGAQPRNYKSMTTVYTGIVSGYDITTTEGTRQDWNIINNAMDNLINIILSQTTLKNVSMRLYAQGLTHLDPDNDNQYLTARTSRYLLNRTPKEVMDLVDRTSEEKTLENLRRFEEADHDNHVYGMFHWNPPYYSYQALSQIKVKRITSSDMLEISYENDDPYIVYNTLVILNDEFVKQYRDLRFGETNNVIAYFESELARVGKNLRELEDSLRDYNVEHKVINYDEQTKHIAALSRDYELRHEEILLNFELLFDRLAQFLGALEVQQDLLVAQFVVAREGGDVLGLLVVVDDTVLDVVVAQRILQVAQVVSHPLQLGFEIGDDVVRLAEPQVAVLLDELVVEDNQRVVDDGRVVVLVADFQHVAVGQPLDLDLAQRLVAVIRRAPVEHAVDVVVMVYLFVFAQVLVGVLFRSVVDELHDVGRGFAQQVPRGACREVLVVVVRVEVRKPLCVEA